MILKMQAWGKLIFLSVYRGLWAMAAKFWKMGMGEFHRSFSKKAFVWALQRLLPEIQGADATWRGRGSRPGA